MKIALLILFATSGVIFSTCEGKSTSHSHMDTRNTFEEDQSLVNTITDGRSDSTTGLVSDEMVRENVIKAIEFLSRTLNVKENSVEIIERDSSNIWSQETTTERQLTSDILNRLSQASLYFLSTALLNFETRYMADSNSLMPLYDCSALNIDKPSGIYTLNLNFRGTHSVRTFCDQNTDGGGWTVILKRSPDTDLKTATNFNRTYTAFKRGFGDPETDFWFGLDKLSLWTSYRNYELRVVLTDFDDATAYSHYDNFYIDREESGYKLRVSGYWGEAGDSLLLSNNMMFSTYDLDQDKHSSLNCGQRYGGGWWYNQCFHANLMSQYSFKTNVGDTSGIQWKHWKTNYLPLKSVIMMIRRTP